MDIEVFTRQGSSRFEATSYTVHADGLLEFMCRVGSVLRFEVGEYSNFEART